MSKFKKLQLATLSRHIAEISICECPSDGWIRSIRKSLGMSLQQLAQRAGISQQSASKIEASELRDSISLKTLRKAASAMNCKLVYAIIPNEGTLEDIISSQAFIKAKEMASPVIKFAKS